METLSGASVPSFTIRKASAKDIPTLVEHRHLMYTEMVHPTKAELKILDESYEKWALEKMRRKLLYGYVVTTSEGKPAASGCIWLREAQPAPGRPAGMVPYLLSMYTRPEFRRIGLASVIVKEAMEWARKRGYHKIVLHASRPGRKVYAKLGWKRTWEMEFSFEEAGRPTRRPRPSKPLRA